MAKGRFGGMPMGGGAQMGNMMKQIQKMQKEMEDTHSELETKTYEARSGGGAVRAVVSGEKKLLEISIAPEVVDPDDVEMLGDLIIAAVNEALSEAEKDALARMSKFTGGIDMKGLF